MNLNKKQTALIARLDKAAAKSGRLGLDSFCNVNILENPYLAPGVYTCWTDTFIMRLERADDAKPNAPEKYPDISKLLNTPKDGGVSYKIQWDTLADALALSSSKIVTVTDAGGFVLLASDDGNAFVLVTKARR